MDFSVGRIPSDESMSCSFFGVVSMPFSFSGAVSLDEKGGKICGTRVLRCLTATHMFSSRKNKPMRVVGVSYVWSGFRLGGLESQVFFYLFFVF